MTAADWLALAAGLALVGLGAGALVRQARAARRRRLEYVDARRVARWKAGE